MPQVGHICRAYSQEGGGETEFHSDVPPNTAMGPALAAPSSPFSVNDEIKINQGSGLSIFFFHLHLFWLLSFSFCVSSLIF